MSTTIDQRVVEMQFDNRHFESNVSTTMSTLDKLKQKLHFDGATKGLENVGTAAKNVNMSALGSAVETVHAKFSAMEVIGVTALANITNSAINAGKRMLSALTIDPVKTGLQEYETQINATQTILANTASKGSDIHDVNKALAELNTYADKTIYNFTEMTRNIGTFTAAGIDLDTSVNAIQGIANLAAVSGSTSQQASTAMYQLSQALASGTVKLMDWNSVVNAGMGGEMFQNALKETSKLLGTGAEEAIKAEGSFRESLRTGWLTAEVLTETLKKFTTTGANERVAEYTGLSKEAVDAALKEAEASAEAAKAKGKEVDAIDLAAEALAKKSGKNKKEIKDTLQFAKTAEDAATKVKTFSQLWDVLKESAQSGWAQTWKIIIGDFEQAKALLSPLADTLTGFINKFSDIRNKVLEKVLGGRDSKWSGLAETLDKAGLSSDKLKDAMGGLTTTMEKSDKYTVKKGDYLSKIAKEYGTTWKEIYDLNKDIIGDNPDLIYPDQVFQMPKVIGEMAKETGKLTDEQLKSKGYTDKQIKAFRELEKAAKDSGMSVEDLLAELSKPMSGRDMIIESFTNVFKELGKAFGAVGDAWKEIFPPKSIDERAAGLRKLIEAFHTFAMSFQVNDEKADKLKRTFKGLFAIIDLIATITGGAFKIAFKVLSAVLSYFNMDILDLTALIGDVIVKFRDWVKRIINIDGAVAKVIPLIKKLASFLGDMFDKVKESGVFKKLIGYLKSAGSAIAKWFKGIDFGKILDNVIPMVKKAGTFITNFFNAFKSSPLLDSFVSSLKNAFNGIKSWIAGLKETDNVPGYIISGLINGLKAGIGAVAKVVWSIGEAIVNAIKSVLGIHSPSTVFMAIGGFLISGLILGIRNGSIELEGVFGELGTKIVNFIKGFDLGGAIAVLSSVGVVTGIKKVLDILGATANFAKGLGDTMSGVGSVLEQGAESLKKWTKSINKVIKNTAKVVKSFSKVLSAVAFNIRTEGIKNLAIAILVLVGALAIITLLNPDKLWEAVGVIGVLSAIMIGLAFAVSKLSGASISITKEGKSVEGLKSSLLGIAAALLIMAITVKIVGGMDEEKAKQGFKNLIIIMGLVVGLLLAMSLINMIPGSVIGMAGDTLKKIAGTLIILAIVAKVLGGMEWNEFKMAAAGMGLLVGVVALLVTITMIPGKNLDTVGNTLMKMVGAIAILAIVAKLFSGMEWSEFKMAAAGLGLLVGVVALLVTITMIPGKNLDTVGNTLLAISGAIAILAIAAKIMASMDWKTFGRAAAGLGLLVGVVALLVLTTKLCSEKDLEKLGITLLAMSGAIAVLALVAAVLGMIPIQNLVKGIVAIGILAGLMALLALATGKAQSVDKGTFIGIAIAIGVMAVALVALSFIPVKKLAAATAALAVVIGMFALLVSATGKANKSMGTLIVMTIAVGLLGTLLYLLAYNVSADDALGAAAAISLVMGVMVGMLAAINKLKVSVKKAIKTTISLLALAIPLLAFVGILALMQNVNTSISSVMSLVVLVGAMTGLVYILSKISINVANAIKGTVALTLLAIPLLAFVGILALMQNVNTSVGTITALIALVSVATLLVVILGKININIGSAIAGILALTLMAIPMLAFVGVLALMQNVSVATTTVTLLCTMLVAMTAVLAVLTIIGAAGPAAFIGIGALATLIAAVGVVVVAIGALTETFPQLESFIDTGIPIMEKLGTALGSFLGNIVGGFMEGITSSLPTIADDLSNFMTKLDPFIQGAKNIDSETMDAVMQLAKVILVLTAAELLQGVTSWLTGDASLSSFGEQLVPFGESLVAFSSTVDGKVNEGAVQAAANAGSIMAAMAKEIPNSGGVLGFIMGNNDIDTFGTQLESFGRSIVNFSNTVSGGQINETAVAAAANAGSIMAAMAKDIPNSGGVLGFIMGNNNIDTFGTQLESFGRSIVAFSDTVSQGSINETAVAAAANAGSIMAAMANEIPNSGGVLGFIMGNNDIDGFGEKMVSFGDSIVKFSNKLNEGNINPDAVAAAANAGSIMASLAADIPTSGGLMGMLLGEQDLGKFGTQIGYLGEGLAAFGNKTKDLDASKLKSCAAAIDVLITVANSVQSSNALERFAEWFSGKKIDWDGYKAALRMLGSCAVEFAEASDGIVLGDVWEGVDAISTILGMPNPGPFVNTICGFPDMTNFSDHMWKLGYGIKRFGESVNDLDSSGVASASRALREVAGIDIKSILASLGNNGGSSLYWFQYNLEQFGAAFKAYGEELLTLDIASMKENTKALGSVVDEIHKAVSGNMNSVREFKNSMKDLGVTAIEGFLSSITKETGKVTKAGEHIILSYVNGMRSKIKEPKSVCKQMLTSCVAELSNVWKRFYNIGSNVVSGFSAGITANTFKARAHAKAMADAALAAAKETLKINSPSKAFREIGMSVPEGFAMGIDKLGSMVTNSSEEMGLSALKTVKNTIRKLADTVNSDIDSQPTIRPVLDLSDVRSGAGRIAGLLNTDSSIGVVANVGRINTMMSGYSQNGANAEVVSAIDKLRKDFGKIGGDTYQFNGVTYDDGSNINDAVKTIIRAARIERRT